MSVTLPIIGFGMDQVVNGSYELTVPCTNGVADLQMKWDLFISNMYYPSSHTFQVKKPELLSNISIYTFQLFKYFQVFGPGYTVYFKGPDAL